MKIKNDQSGIASMVIVILIMTLLTLIVVSMSQNSNREQRQALDRQLNSQALYAAESGIADAKDYVTAPPAGHTPDDDKTTCEGINGAADGDQFPGKSSVVGSDDSIRYSCVLYDKHPTDLIDDEVSTAKPTVMPLEDADGGVIQSLTFSWKKTGSGTGSPIPGVANTHSFTSCHTPGQRLVLPSVWPAANCDAGMLRVELMDPEASNRQDFLNKIFLAYFKPTNSNTTSSSWAKSIGTGITNQGALLNGKCDANDDCETTITNVSSSKLYLNLRSIYIPNSFKVTGLTDSGVPIKFKDAQMNVDSTGRANDILKRISVRIPLSGQDVQHISPFVIQAKDEICKLLELSPGGATPVADNCQ